MRSTKCASGPARILVLCWMLSPWTIAGFVWAAEGEAVLQQLQQATSELIEANTYELRYGYRAGETVQYLVEHMVSVDTTISGNNQKTQLRTKSGRALQIDDVQPNGAIRFTHRIDYVEMWSEVTGREPVHYDSRQSTEVPPEYQYVAGNIGRPISVITINSLGQVLDRQDQVTHPNLGLGGISIPLPDKAVPIGYRWSQPVDIKVRLDNQQIQTIKTRELYQLEKVETGVATISLRTEVLTPVDDARVRSQLIQRISHGTLRFDIDAGRLISKQLDWDESVVGFSGAESNMKYLARFTETLVDPAASAQTASQPVGAQGNQLK